MPHVEYKGSDGEIWPSATELTALLPKDWVWAWYKGQVKKHGWRGWQKCLATSNRGKRIGSETHACLEWLIKQDSDFSPSNAEAMEYAKALFDTVGPRIEDVVAVEPHLVSQNLKIHGSADLIVRLNGDTGLWIGDWKTSDKIDIAHPLQLAVYALCWNEQHPDLRIDQGFIARINKKSSSLKVHVDEYKGLKYYFPVVMALRDIWDYIHASGPWKKPEDY